MRCLITGGAGFIGNALCDSLLRQSASVVVFDNLSEQIHGVNARFRRSDVEFVKGDISNYGQVQEVINSKRFDVVFHLASETGTGQSMYEVENYVRVNDLGTANLLQAIATSANPKSTRLILTSSRSVYGEGAYSDALGNRVTPPPRSAESLRRAEWNPISDTTGEQLRPVPSDENSMTSPASLYAVTKLAQELQVKCVCEAHNIPYGIVRFQNVYGEGQSLRNPYTGIISIFYNRLRQGMGVDLFEDGQPVRDFVHVTDAVQGLIKLASHITEYRSFPVFNIGSGVPTTVQEVAEELATQCNIPSMISITGNFRVGDIRHNVACLKRAQSELEYWPTVPFSEGIKAFCSWASTQPAFPDKSEEAMNDLKRNGLAIS